MTGKFGDVHSDAESREDLGLLCSITISLSFFSCFFYSMIISLKDRTRRMWFSYNYSMSFTYSQMVITKQAGDTLYTRSYNLKDQNM